MIEEKELTICAEPMRLYISLGVAGRPLALIKLFNQVM